MEEEARKESLEKMIGGLLSPGYYRSKRYPDLSDKHIASHSRFEGKRHGSTQTRQLALEVL